MIESDYTPDDFRTQLENYIKEEARKKSHFPKPLLFKIDHLNGFQLVDSKKTIYRVEKQYMESFKQLLQDKSYRFAKINSWDIQFIFNGKKVNDIFLTSTSITLIASKMQRKEIRDCTFRMLVENKDSIVHLTKTMKGYLNRIGKRNLVNLSDNVSIEMKTLITFVKKPNIINPIERISIVAQESKPQVDPISLLNNKGKQTLQKLRNFISRHNLIDFMYDKQLSEDGVRKMRRLAFPQATQSKKFTKNIVESLQNNIIQ